MTANSKSLEQRLYEAWRTFRGITLSADDVTALCRDDTIRTRITNAACHEAGVDEIGRDCLRYHETWAELVERMKGDA